jgi:putative redox protein
MSRPRTAHLVHLDGERFSATTGTGRTIVYGGDTGANELSPVELIVVSLAACSAMDVISICVKKRQAIERYEIHATATQRDEYPQVLTEATVTHEVWGRDVTEVAIRRAIELSATKYCPVNAMVSAGATAVHHRFRIHGPDGDGDVVSEGLVVTTGPYRRPDVLG